MWPRPYSVFSNIRFPCRGSVLLGGGLFLLAKGTTEIHATVEGVEEEMRAAKPTGSYLSVIVQIAILILCFRWTA